MKNAPGKSSAAAMLMIAVTMRLFWGIAVDRPFVPNAGWICPLAGLAIYLPLCFAVSRAEKLGGDSAWGNLAKAGPKFLLHAAEILFSLLLLYDCATGMHLMASTANVVALSEVSIILLLLPLGAMLAAVVLLGGDALGNSARLWLRIMPVLLAVVFIVQVRVYNPSWLTPVFGRGTGDILGGGLYCGGCLAVLTLPWMISLPDRNKRPLIFYIGLSVLAAALLLAASQMLSPPIEGVELSRTSRIKLILSNGRSALSLQMVLIVLWYGAMMQLIGAEAVSAACYLKRAIPKAPQWALAVGEAVLTIIAASSGLTAAGTGRAIYPWMFAAVGGLLAIVMAACLCRRGGKACEG